MVSFWTCAVWSCGCCLSLQSLSEDNNLSAATRANEAEEVQRGCQWGLRRVFVVGGGQEVAGVEACAQDKWSDRCGDGSVGRPPESLCVWLEASFTLLCARCFRGKWLSILTHSLKIRTFNILRTCVEFYNLSQPRTLQPHFFMNNNVVCSQAGSCSCARILHMHVPLHACHCKID